MLSYSINNGWPNNATDGSMPPPEPKPPPSDAEIFDQQLTELNCIVDVMTQLIDRGQLGEDDRTMLAGRVADYNGRLQVIAHKLQAKR